MRWDKSRMNLHSWTEWGRFFLCVCVCCLLTVLWAFVPASSQMSLNVSHGICCRRELICMRASCFDRLSVLPSSFSVWKARDISLSLLHFHVLFIFSFLVTLQVDLGLGPAKAFVNWSVSVCKARFFIYCKVYQPLTTPRCTPLTACVTIYVTHSVSRLNC